MGSRKGDLSLNALEAIKSCDKVFVRSAVPESVNALTENGVKFESFDELFKKCRTFDGLSKKIAKAVVDEAKNSSVAYCVDGSVSEDIACAKILKKFKTAQIFEAAPRGAALIASSCERGAYTCVSAYSIEKINAAVALPLVVYDIDDAYLAGEIKLKLCDLFGDECPAIISGGGKREKISLYELDRQNMFGYDCAVIVGELPLMQKKRFSVEDLFEILHVLRSPNGCPWDRAQTRESITPNLLEECYELYDALKSGDTENIVEEEGDVLLQLAFHSVFGEENHEFDRGDVVSGICRKLIDRHTHVFGGDLATDGDSALAVWDKNKKKEKHYSGVCDYCRSVPRSFPALMRAQKVQKRAGKYNFDFSNVSQIYDKINEETGEVKSAKTSEELFEEVGDLLFSVVNLARFLKVDAEEALSASTEKFLNRLEKTEQAATAAGENAFVLSAEKWDGYYNEIKKR